MSEGDERTRDAIAVDLEDTIRSLLGMNADAPLDGRRRLEALGLDSLLAMDLLSALEKRYGSLPETVLRDHPTVHSLADFLRKKKQGG